MEGLYVGDGSVLPRSSRVNPALTIYAWGLRLGEHLARRARDEPMRRLLAISRCAWLVVALAPARPGRRSRAARAQAIGAGRFGRRSRSATWTARSPSTRACCRSRWCRRPRSTGDAYERLFGVFGLRARIVRLRLGDEEIELIDYLAPEGRPIPVDTRSNDVWFQHVAIIVSDMDARLRAAARAQRAARLDRPADAARTGTRTPAASRRSTSRTPTATTSRSCSFPPDKGDPRWHEPGDGCSSASTTPRSWCATPRRASPSSRSPRARGRRRERELRDRAGAPEQRVRRAPSDHRAAARPPGPGRVPRLSGAARRPAVPAGHAGERSLALADPHGDAGSGCAREGSARAGAAFVSPGIVEMPDDHLGLGRALMVRSPVGHAVLITEAGVPE